MGRRLGRGQMPLERCPQGAAAAVQQHPLISVADLQDVTNFLRGPSLHITEGYDLALPPAQREVVTLRDVEGWAAEEVCNVLEVSDTNQRVLLHRGRSPLRAALERH